MPKANNCGAGTVYSYGANNVPGCNALPDALSRAIFTLTCPPNATGSFGSDGNQDCIANCQAPNVLKFGAGPGPYDPNSYTYCVDPSGNMVPGSSTQVAQVEVLPMIGPGPTLNPSSTPTPTPTPTNAVNGIIADLQAMSPMALAAIAIGAYFLLKSK